MEENKPSFDPAILVPAALAALSILGIAVIFFVTRAEAQRPTAEPADTATPFRFVYLGTEPGLSTLTPEPTPTFVLAPSELPEPRPPEMTELPSDTEVPGFPSFPTSVPTNPAFPTQPAGRTATPAASETLPAVLSKFDDTYYEILYDGEWTSQTNVTGAYQNTLHISFTIENYAYFTFVGQQVIVTFQAGPSLGTILIDLDGIEFQVSQTSTQTQLVDWRSPVLVMGTHELIIEHLSGGSVNLDSITIPDLRTPTPEQ
jgi:hypothetical protein